MAIYMDVNYAVQIFSLPATHHTYTLEYTLGQNKGLFKVNKAVQKTGQYGLSRLPGDIISTYVPSEEWYFLKRLQMIDNIARVIF